MNNECFIITLVAWILTVLYFYLIDFVFCREPKKYIGSKKWKEDITKRVEKLETELLTKDWEKHLKVGT